MLYAQSIAKVHIWAKQNVFLPLSKNSDSQLDTHSTVEDWKNWGEMKLNEPGRQTLGRYKPCRQEQHAKLYSDLLQA